MNKRLYDGWKGMGDCSCCRHKDICREQCEANEEFASRLVKKELLFDLDKKQRELSQNDKTQDNGR